MRERSKEGRSKAREKDQGIPSCPNTPLIEQALLIYSKPDPFARGAYERGMCRRSPIEKVVAKALAARREAERKTFLKKLHNTR